MTKITRLEVINIIATVRKSLVQNFASNQKRLFLILKSLSDMFTYISETIILLPTAYN